MKNIYALGIVIVIAFFSTESSFADCVDSGGFCSGSVNTGFIITRGVSSGRVELASTTFVPSVDVVLAPDPSIDWGDGTTSNASTSATTFFSCLSCGLSGVHTYSTAGEYTITLTYNTGCCVSYSTTIPVTVVDPTVVIGSIGDSVFSGEGNPDVNQQWGLEGLFPDQPEALFPGAPPIWGETDNDETCHRSSFAPANLVRNILEQQNPNVNYSVENLACTGGSIEATGDQAENLSDDVDVLVISSGANNIGGGFSNIFGACLQQGGDCAAHPQWGDIIATTAGLIPGLPDGTQGFTHLNDRITTRGIPGLSPSDIFIAEYYDPTRDANGNFGSGNCMLDGDLEFFVDVVIPFINFFQDDEDDWLEPDKWEWDSATWQLLYNTIVDPLNENVANASAMFGWNYVGGIAAKFRNHGMCAFEHGGTPWVRGFNVDGTTIVSPFLESFRVQGDVTGSLHPNHEGALAIANRIQQDINFTRTPNTSLNKDGVFPVTNQISIAKDTLFSFRAFPDQKFPSSSGLSTTYYYVEPAGGVSGDCNPESQSACNVASPSGFNVQVTGGGSWEVGYFSCNKWNSHLKTQTFPFGHPRAGDSMEGVGCEAVQTATISMDTPTELCLTYPSGEPYVQGEWSSQSITAELSTMNFNNETYFSISDDIQDTSCNSFTFNFSCTAYGAPFQIFQQGSNYLTYFSIGGAGASGGSGDLIDPRELLALVNIDSIAPEIGNPTVMPVPNVHGWNNSDVTVSWPCTDAGSGPVESTVVAQFTQEGEHQMLIRSCQDYAGLFSDAEDAHASIDKTPPIANANVSRGEDSHGWYNRPFSISWTGTDALSGINKCELPEDYSGPDTAAGDLRGGCEDKAGNLSSVSSFQFQYDSTSPVVSALPSRTANTAGWHNQAFTVNFSGSDNLSGIASCSGDTQIAGPDTDAGQVQGQCADIAGNLSLVNTFDFKYDGTAPTLSPAPDRIPDSNGWYNDSFTVTWPGTDNHSGIASCSEEASFSGPDTNTGLLQGSCIDLADNDTGAVDFSFLYDATNPSVAPAPERQPDSNGWYNHAFSVAWPGSDNLSGIAQCTATDTFAGPDTNAGSLQGNCLDVAGNDSGLATYNFNYDATEPTINYVGNAGSYRVTDTVSIVCVAEDNLSGVASDSCANVNGAAYEFAVGPNSYSAVAQDVAGNQGSGETTFDLLVEHDDLATLVCSFISNRGLCNSLSQKLSNVKAAVAAGRSNQASNLLGAFVNQLEAQRDKAITSAEVDTVLRLMGGLPQ